MKVKDLKKLLDSCNDDAEVQITTAPDEEGFCFCYKKIVCKRLWTTEAMDSNKKHDILSVEPVEKPVVINY